MKKIARDLVTAALIFGGMFIFFGLALDAYEAEVEAISEYNRNYILEVRGGNR